jgi:hypothetical protein
MKKLFLSSIFLGKIAVNIVKHPITGEFGADR